MICSPDSVKGLGASFECSPCSAAAQVAATCASDSRQHVSVPRLGSVSCANPAA